MFSFVPLLIVWAKGPRIRLSRFRTDTSGATAVEFGLISIPFLGLLFAIFQTCLGFLMQQGLKVAVDNAARQVLTGTAQNNTAVKTWQTFRNTYVCTSLLPSFLTCSNIVVDVRPYSSFSSVTAANMSQSFLTDSAGASYSTGNPCDIVVVRAIYPMPVFLPLLSATTLGASSVTTNKAGLTTYNGSLVQMLTAASVFRNEPYVVSGSSSSASSGCSS